MIIRLPGFCESIFILFILSDSVNFVEYSPFLEIFVDAIARLLYYVYLTNVCYIGMYIQQHKVCDGLHTPSWSHAR